MVHGDPPSGKRLPPTRATARRTKNKSDAEDVSRSHLAHSPSQSCPVLNIPATVEVTKLDGLHGLCFDKKRSYLPLMQKHVKNGWG